MPLAPGDKLGPYEILSLLGKGGMGEVYRARDPKLNREVAIKVLPTALANDSDYILRFQREAQTLASLNHPNIASIYGLEANAIVMELVEGETLQGPLAISDALPIARQIAEALEGAHDKGIIHRDLKPGNIKLTPEGVVKVLDFGLAKAVAERPAQTGPDSPTLTLRATEAGLILGTAGYMSPEQAAGKPVDRRADIWSFGVVLHELITGKRIFDGETVSHTLAHVLTANIDLALIPPGHIRDLIGRCLDRNLKTRLRDIGEARIAIENYLANPHPAAPAPTQSKRSLWPWAIAAACLLAAVAGWSPLLRKPSQPTQSAKTDINPPEGSRFAEITNAGGSAISPDGRTLAFVATNAKGETLLHLRPLDSLEARAVPGTEDAGRPFWSPDSKSLGFVVGGKLKRIDVAGGTPITLCDARFARGGTWSENGLILFGDQASGLQSIPASGGTPSLVTQLNREDGETSHYYPQFLPGGKEFLYLVRHSNPEKRAVVVGSLDGKPAIRLVHSDYMTVYDAASHRLLYIQGAGTLMARQLELNPPRLTGDPVVVAEHVGVSGTNGFANLSVSSTGTLFYSRSTESARRRFGWRDRAGKLLETVGQPVEMNSTFRLSPDGSRVAFAVGRTQQDLWMLDLARGVSTRLTFSNALLPAWSPDGKQIYYRNATGIFRKAADGSGEEELVRKGVAENTPQSVSPDATHLLIGDSDILSLPLTGEPKPEPYLQTKYQESNAAFSPDGRWVAYLSNESGRAEIYIQGFPERRGKWQVSSAGGIRPLWRADGKELYWATQEDRTLMAAPVELQTAGVRVGPAAPLFRMAATPFQPAPDGKRFLVYEPEGAEPPARPMAVVLNWAAGLGK